MYRFQQQWPDCIHYLEEVAHVPPLYPSTLTLQPTSQNMKIYESVLWLKLRYHATHPAAHLHKEEAYHKRYLVISANLTDFVPQPKMLALSSACSTYNSGWQYCHSLHTTQQKDDSTKRSWQWKSARDTRVPHSVPFLWDRESCLPTFALPQGERCTPVSYLTPTAPCRS